MVSRFVLCVGVRTSRRSFTPYSPVLVIGVGSFVAGVGRTVFGTLWTTTMQREIPSVVLSRVSAYDWFGSLVFLPIGMALVGPVQQVYGLTTTIVGAAILLVVFIAVTLFVPSITTMRADQRFAITRRRVGRTRDPCRRRRPRVTRRHGAVRDRSPGASVTTIGLAFVPVSVHLQHAPGRANRGATRIRDIGRGRSSNRVLTSVVRADRESRPTTPRTASWPTTDPSTSRWIPVRW